MDLFAIEHVALQFDIANLLQLLVASNILCMVFPSKVLYIDLDQPQTVNQVHIKDTLRRAFLDVSGCHLLVVAESETYYVHLSDPARTPRPLARLSSLDVTAVAWNPFAPTDSTHEILVGTASGDIYETYISSSPDYFKKEDRYLRHVFSAPTTAANPAIVGLVAQISNSDSWNAAVIAYTATAIYCWKGPVPKGRMENLYASIAEGNQKLVTLSYQAPHKAFYSTNISPIDHHSYFAYAHDKSVTYGPLDPSPNGQIFLSTKSLQQRSLASKAPYSAAILTQYHLIALSNNTLTATNLLNGQTVYSQTFPDSSDPIIGMCADQRSGTFWFYSAQNIYELVASNEDRDVWRVLLDMDKFDSALALVEQKPPAEKDEAVVAIGEKMLANKLYLQVAALLGKSSKRVAEVASTFIENQQYDPLAEYLDAKLSTFSKSAVSQRTILAMWIMELYIERLNRLEELASTTDVPASFTSDSTEADAATYSTLLTETRKEFFSFLTENKPFIDKQTSYQLLAVHGRQDELLECANVFKDHDYIIAHWVRLGNWDNALSVLLKQEDMSIIYRFATVLLSNAPEKTVALWMRFPELDPSRLLPAIMTLQGASTVPVNARKQAIRYLRHVTETLHSTSTEIHNVLLGMYASVEGNDEDALLEYLESQGREPHYDPNFGLQITLKYQRIKSCAYIYVFLDRYEEAVDLALTHNNLEVAIMSAERQTVDSERKKRTWLKIVQHIIDQSKESGSGISKILALMHEYQSFTIAELLPLIPGWIDIREFKDDICESLEKYNKEVEQLKSEIAEVTITEKRAVDSLNELLQRYVIVEPGESCRLCRYPLLSEQFYVFPCQHAFHVTCLIEQAMERSSKAMQRKLQSLRVEYLRGNESEALDALIASECALCGDAIIDTIDMPFCTEQEMSRWAIA
ncbi:hypothetical protein CANCADRAFT_30776 [Tortispora caseinolytica NRRL Y-17796]|uniref:Pep3/Vps18/deep orange domain-containing protein n=1 Tax=Tortispora caseinolytica NRRL Y-17796 TaxID=767744 RepID=A0A1E4TLR0_9ASCO|nr:hypothetical protein CANCADRAFT_30776 [Tortispora caseinolytica NRRL Y-17796]